MTSFHVVDKLRELHTATGVQSVPVLFISHSTKDDALTSCLETWLKQTGFTDIFIDHANISGGDKWRDALRASAHACRVVICFVTPNWLASTECFNEFGAAWYMGKRIVPLLLLPGEPLGEQEQQRLGRVLGEDQGIDLRPCCLPDGSLDISKDESVAARLANGLKAAGANTLVGLDPKAFDINRDMRPTPFPGLSAFDDEDADAAIFYGRSREIEHILEELRTMRAMRDLRPLVILGASGAGKSSLLRAGIIPRLRRETPAWLPLRAFRPGADPLLNFAEAISRTGADFGQQEAYGDVRDRLLQTWREADRSNNQDLGETGLAEIASALEAEGHKLRTVANRPSATILISVDQAEELARSVGESGEALADYLRVALASEASNWQLAFTIRTDSFSELQRHRRFQDLEARGYDLRSLPVFRFADVIEDPAKRYGVEIDPVMIDKLMEDAPKEDALPLLAFAMQRLWRQYAASGSLDESNYVAVGGLTGLIEDAAERALHGIDPEQDVPVPTGQLSSSADELGASAFVPPLAQIRDHDVVVRRVADWNSFTDEQKSLLSRFDRWRLVVRKGVDAINGIESGTVEVAHEALFREWPRLKRWIDDSRHLLNLQRQLSVDADRFFRERGNPHRWEFCLQPNRAREANAAISDNKIFFPRE